MRKFLGKIRAWIDHNFIGDGDYARYTCAPDTDARRAEKGGDDPSAAEERLLKPLDTLDEIGEAIKTASDPHPFSPADEASSAAIGVVRGVLFAVLARAIMSPDRKAPTDQSGSDTSR